MDDVLKVLLKWRALNSRRWHQVKTFNIPSHIESLKILYQTQNDDVLEFKVKRLK